MKSLLLFAVGALAVVVRADAGKDSFLFTYFVGNGEDGLHLALSDDGLHWQPLHGGRSVLTPAVGKDRLMRDPCVTRGPDGTFHLVWTTGWWDNAIGHASTRDFLNWSGQQQIPVMAHETKVRNSWAPEVIWDPTRQRFLVFWASTIPGRYPNTAGASEDELNHRIYCTTTEDWKSFAPTRLFCDPGFSVIDATLLPGERGAWHLIVKDETLRPPKKHLRLGTAPDPEGPWETFGPPFTRDWVEGPTALRLNGQVIVYYDVYREHHFGAVRSADLAHWQDATPDIAIPPGARHGTIVRIPAAVRDTLLASEPASSAKN